MSDQRIEAVKRELGRYRDELRSALDSVPAPSREARPRDGAWSAANVLEHLADTERSVTALLGKLVGKAPPRAHDDFDADAFARHIDMPAFLDRTRKLRFSQPSGAVEAAAAWKALEESRARLLEVLGRAEGLKLEDVSYDHPAGRSLDGYRWLAFLALHEGRHAAQIREIGEELARSGITPPT